MVALLFPGQGSQFVGMGADLIESSPAARAVFEEADDVLGIALTRLCREGPEDELTATLNAQPAILTHSIAVFRTIADGIGPVQLAAGHSLGEFSAYVAAGALSFAEAVRIVRRRGELMYRSGEERPGTMAAVLGVDDEVAERVCAEASGASGVCVAANYNAPGQLVISGDVAAVDAAIELLKAAGAKRAIRLNVSGAFHSPLMQPAADGLREAIESATFGDPAFPVVSNVTAEPVSDRAQAEALLLQQLTSPVRWTRSMQRFAAEGVQQALELGPGAVLAGLMKRIERSIEVRSIGTAADVGSFVGQGA